MESKDKPDLRSSVLAELWLVVCLYGLIWITSLCWTVAVECTGAWNIDITPEGKDVENVDR